MSPTPMRQRVGWVVVMMGGLMGSAVADVPALVDFAVAEVFGYGLVADVLAVVVVIELGVEGEAAQVVGEVQVAVGGEQLHAAVQQLGVVALDVEGVGRFFAVGEAGRVDDDEVELFVLGDGFIQVGGNVGADEWVGLGVDAVEGKVALRPVEVGVG